MHHNPVTDLDMIVGWHLELYPTASGSCFSHSHLLVEAFNQRPMEGTWTCCLELGVKREAVKLQMGYNWESVSFVDSF